MNYDTFGGTTDKITEYINKLNELKSCLTTDLLESDAGNFDEINSKIDEIISKLEEIDISSYAETMQNEDSHFSK